MNAQEVIRDCLSEVGYAFPRRASELILDALKADGFELVKPELGKLSADWLAQAQRFPEATRKFAHDLINATPDGARYAVVKLPEPDMLGDFGQVWTNEGRCNGPIGTVQYMPHDGRIEIRDDYEYDYTSADVRRDAAVLLAAAVAAEEAGQ